jgi:phenylalanyl-tRNA synthetase beta chain
LLISLNWLKDFVDIPADLDPRVLAERFTLTCAEVEGVSHIRKGDRTPVETVSTFDDWIIELDNKSITHRPDLWGHYGVAREIAALLKLPLKLLQVADRERLLDDELPEIPIEIDDPRACPRYSAVLLSGVSSQPAPEWMQGRLTHVGIRPINALVDLSNYVMAELGQPTHAFDGDRVRQIEVAAAAAGETFVTLDGVQRKLPAAAVMIQAQRRNVALGGIMGGLDSEVAPSTTRLLLESASFDAATIRRTAAALGHRTEASARFEKSLDPELTVLAIGRFICLAEPLFPELRLESRLSDCFPSPPEPRSIPVNPGFVSALIGKNISFSEMKDILEAIEFKVEDAGDHVEVLVPSFRATKDILVEADVIEEIARFVGYGNIEPVLPLATVRRFPPSAQQRLEQRTAELLCRARGCYEMHDYIWYHDDWLATLGWDPGDCIRLRNPPAQGQERLRRSVIPGLLQAAELNRRELPALRLMTIGSVFRPGSEQADVSELQARSLGLLFMSRERKAEETVLAELKATIEAWSRELFDWLPSYAPLEEPRLPWEDGCRSACLVLDSRTVGRLGTVPIELRRRIDEHFAPWSIAVAEIDLSMLFDHEPGAGKLRPIPPLPEVDLDFSVLVPMDRAYCDIEQELEEFGHRLLRRLSFEGSYEGASLPQGTRSVLLRARIGSPDRTLEDEDIKDFSALFETFLNKHGLKIRA